MRHPGWLWSGVRATNAAIVISFPGRYAHLGNDHVGIGVRRRGPLGAADLHTGLNYYVSRVDSSEGSAGAIGFEIRGLRSLDVVACVPVTGIFAA